MFKSASGSIEYLNIFELSGKKSWGKILKKLGNKYRIWWDSPDDIYLN